MRFSRMLNVVGVHAAGALNQVITGGVLDPPGRTVFEKMRHLETRADELRLFLLQQPRGRVRQCVNLVVPALGFEVVPAEAASLVEVGERIKEAAAGQVPAVHPDIPRSTPSTRLCSWSRSARRRAACARQRDRGFARNVDRSPCGSGSSARLAMMHARGEIEAGQRLVHESLLGTEFIGVVRGTTEVGGRPAIHPTITGRGWITAFHQYVLDPSDPFPTGFRLGDTWPGA
jgi:proline racemase